MKNIIIQLLISVELVFFIYAEYIGKLDLSQGGPTLTYRQLCREQTNRQVNKINAQQRTYKLEAYPQFSSYTIQELSEIYNNKIMQSLQISTILSKPKRKIGNNNNDNQQPIFVNNTFLTGRPKHQGRCGGCYAFAGNSVVNYPINRYYLPYNTTEKIRQASQQQIIECSFIENNNGCNGGWPHLAMNYIKRYGVLSDLTYRYRPQTFLRGEIQNCQIARSIIKELYINRSVVKVSRNNQIEEYIDIIDNHKVAAIGVTANNTDFMYYKSGVLTSCGVVGARITHAVTLVGYKINYSGQLNVWYIKNSYGASWGVYGHIFIEMDNNICGVLTYISYLITYR